MRCRTCSAKAIIRLPRHNTAFCPACFSEYVTDQIERAIKSDRMFGRDEGVAVAVSGGKDSLVLWEILSRLGYPIVRQLQKRFARDSHHAMARATAI